MGDAARDALATAFGHLLKLEMGREASDFVVQMLELVGNVTGPPPTPESTVVIEEVALDDNTSEKASAPSEEPKGGLRRPHDAPGKVEKFEDEPGPSREPLRGGEGPRCDQEDRAGAGEQGKNPDPRPREPKAEADPAPPLSPAARAWLELQPELEATAAGRRAWKEGALRTIEKFEGFLQTWGEEADSLAGIYRGRVARLRAWINGADAAVTALDRELREKQLAEERQKARREQAARRRAEAAARVRAAEAALRREKSRLEQAQAQELFSELERERRRRKDEYLEQNPQRERFCYMCGTPGVKSSRKCPNIAEHKLYK